MPYGSLVIKFAADLAELKTDVGKAATIINRDLNRALSATKVALGALGAGAAVAALQGMVKASVDAQDAINKMSQRVGVGVESLSALKYAAELSDVQFEALGSALQKFNKNVAETQANTGDAKDAFKTLGISVTNSQGALRSTEDVLLAVADKFAGMQDGAAKTALAMKLFGKSGAELIPFLNQGSAGIQTLSAEAKRLGIVLDGEAAAAAEKFNDDLKRMHAATQGIVTQITIGLVPVLDDLANEFRRTNVESEKWQGIGTDIGEVLKGVAIAVVATTGFIKALTNTLGAFAAVAAQAAQFNFAGAIDIAKGLEGDNAKIKKDMDDRIAMIRTLGGEAGKLRRDIENFADVGGGKPTRRPGPVLFDEAAAKKAQAEMEKFAKAAADLAISRAKAEATSEQGLADERLKILERFHADGLIDEEHFWKTKLKLQQDAITAQMAVADQEVASAQAALTNAEKARNVSVEGATKYLEALKALEEAQNKRNELDSKFASAAVTNYLDSQDAAKRYAEAVRSLNAQLLDLQGNSAEAAKIRFDDQMAQMKRIAQSSGDTGTLKLIEDLGKATAAQAQFNQMRADAGLATGQLAIEEERIRNSRETGAISEFRSLKETGDARQRSLRQLQSIAKEMERIAGESKNPFLVQQAAEFTVQIEKLAGQTDLLGQKFDKIGETAFATFLDDVVSKTKSVSDAFKSMIDSIVKQINRLAAEEISNQLFNAMGGGTGRNAGGGASGFGSFFSKLFSPAAPASFGTGPAFGNQDMGQFLMGLGGMAGGGRAGAGQPYVVGEQGPELFVPDSSGMVVPQGSWGGRVNVVNNFTVTGPVDRRSQDQIALAAGRGVNRALSRNG